MRFTVLASGSSGNSSLVEAAGTGILLDMGLGPRQLAARLAAAGTAWTSVQAVLLTHTHGDHWRPATLAHLARLGIPLWCHADHLVELQAAGTACSRLHAAGLIRLYEAHQTLKITPQVSCLPLPVRHDSGPTFGFRIELSTGPGRYPVALAYAADLGSWTLDLARALANVQLLALEFNHDVALEYASGRSPRLIARVLGEEGHLSNEQAAALLGEVLRQSEPGRLRHVVQLHLSRECNRPRLAAAAARRILHAITPEVALYTANQECGCPAIEIASTHAGAAQSRNHHSPTRRGRWRVSTEQRWLPGFEVAEHSP